MTLQHTLLLSSARSLVMQNKETFSLSSTDHTPGFVTQTFALFSQSSLAGSTDFYHRQLEAWFRKSKEGFFSTNQALGLAAQAFTFVMGLSKASPIWQRIYFLHDV